MEQNLGNSVPQPAPVPSSQNNSAPSATIAPAIQTQQPNPNSQPMAVPTTPPAQSPKTWTILTALTILIILGTGGYFVYTKTQKQNQKQPTPTAPSTSKVNIAQSGFDSAIFKTTYQSEKNKNVFISPYSIEMALKLVLNGASGTTKNEISQALELVNKTDDTINREAQANMQRILELDPQVEMNIANSIWVQDKMQLKKNFQTLAQNNYQAEVGNVDFGSPKALETINNWVNQKTKEKIKKVFEKLGSDTVSVLVNAIYFKGKWTNEFDKLNTQNQTFYLDDGTEKEHPIMNNSGYYQYFENSELQAIKMPYGEKKFSMNIFLPNKNTNINEFIAGITDEKITLWISDLEQKDGDISIPSFKFSYEIPNFIQALNNLGIEQVFTGLSKLDKIVENKNLFITQAVHKAYIDTDETGTEAAAVTGLAMEVTATIPVDDRFAMICNRPFFFVIQDDIGTNLFMGAILNPEV